MKTFYLLLSVLALLLRSSTALHAVAYFLVGEIREQIILHDSYVLPLYHPEDIAYARTLIQEGWHNKHSIVGARIEAGADVINRDYFAPGQPQWSWHVAEFLRFADSILDPLEGTPTSVEQNLAQRIAEGGIIGFSGYTIVAEVGPAPLALDVMQSQKAVEFRWTDLGTNYVYTLESKDLLGAQNWAPVAGPSWPARTNQFVLPRPVSNKFFRVTATNLE